MILSTNNIKKLPWLNEEFILSKALEISYSYGRHWSFETMTNQSSVHKPRMDEWMDRWIDRCKGGREEQMMEAGRRKDNLTLIKNNKIIINCQLD